MLKSKATLTQVRKMTSLRKFSDGFETDMNTLLRKFVAAKTARFTKFSELWREMQFSLIFCGRQDPRERLVFFEEIIVTVLKLWHPSCDFQQQVFALYMLYALYTSQPSIPKLKIRLRLQDWKQSEELLQLAQKDDHLDVCYCIHRMRIEKCFHFVFYLRQRTPLMAVNREEDVDSATLKHEVFSRLGESCKTGALKCVALMHQEYLSTMAAVQQSSAVPSVSLMQENAAEGIIGKITELQAKYKVDEEVSADEESDNSNKESSSSEDETDTAARRRALRQQQFTSTSTTRKGQRYEQLMAAASMPE